MLKKYLLIENISKRYTWIIIIIALSVNLFSGQQLSPKQIDSISNASQLERSAGNIQKFLEIQKSLTEKSKKSNYPKGIAMSYFHSGVAMQMLGDHSKAIDYFNLAKKEPYAKDNWALQSELAKTMGECYALMQLFKASIVSYKSAIVFAEKADDSKVGLRKANNYNNIGIAFGNIPNSTDSIYYYYSKAYYYTKFPSKEVSANDQLALKALIASNLGWVLDTKNNSDSARYYFQKALNMNESVENIASNINVNYMMGDSYARSKEYPKAIEYLNKSLKYAVKADDTYGLKDNYKALADIYKILGDDKKYIEFTDLYIKASNDLKANELNATQKSIDNIVKDKEDGFQNSKSKLYWIIGGIIVLAILASIIAFLFHRNMKRRKQKIISEKTQVLANKDEIIRLKEEETDELKLQLNESFEEVIQLGKENKPEFLTRFQEVYPDFYQKLIDMEPRLLATEIKLCAMIHLGFSSKDIAEYTFVTLKAAQHRKFRLRKKLSIPSDVDINVWLDE